MDSTKSAISVMFCGSAAGKLLPPYVVYKGQNVYPAWCVGGVKGAVYSATKSGWFDTFTFTDFFKVILLPAVQLLPGKKLMVGDNLASHISLEVIDLCREHEIEFVCLPPNSTDKLQPLDVGVFGPLKRKWKEQVKRYKDQDPKANLLVKTIFPAMLKELIGNLNVKEHLPRAFEKCGLVPCNPDKVKERIPCVLQTEEIARHLDSVLVERLAVRRFGDGSKKKPRGLKVPAGQSYTAARDQEENEEESEVESMAESEPESEPEAEESEAEEPEDLPDPHGDVSDADRQYRESGSYVVASYEGQWFLAEISQDQSNVGRLYTRLNYMVIKGKNAFAPPLRPDIHVTLMEDILLGRVIPEPVNQRGYLGLCPADLKKVVALMVLVYKSSIYKKIAFLMGISFSKILSA